MIEDETLTSEKELENNNTIDTSLHQDATWGPWLFRLTMAGTLIFMWWLVIYDHGVAPHH